MKFQIREGAAASLGTAAVVARILYGVTIDLPWLYNSGWISVLLGGVLALPVALAAAQLRAASAGKSPLSALNARRPVLARLLAGMLMLTAAFDATMAVDAIADSAGYAALDSVAKIYLLLPQLALCAWGLTLNGDAIGDSARICNRILLCIFVLFMLREIPDLCPEWLTPILGPGVPALLDGAVRVAGWLSLLAGLFLIAEPDVQHPANAIRPVSVMAIGGAIGMGLVLLHGMMLPALVRAEGFSRYFLLDTVLTNGRTTLALQLPKMIVWFGSLFFLMLSDSFLCAAMLQTVAPRLPRFVCIGIVTAGIAALALTNVSASRVETPVGRWLYAAQAGVMLAAMVGLALERKEAQRA